MNNQDIFYKRIGEILNASLNTESLLEYFISRYFISHKNDKVLFFQDKILLNMRFEQKFQLFKEICKREKVNQIEIKKICGSIKFIQELRNKVAHWQAFATFSENEEWNIQLKKRACIIEEKDTQKLDKALMDRLEKERLNIVTGVTNIHLLIDMEKV